MEETVFRVLVTEVKKRKLVLWHNTDSELRKKANLHNFEYFYEDKNVALVTLILLNGATFGISWVLILK